MGMLEVVITLAMVGHTVVLGMDLVGWHKNSTLAIILLPAKDYTLLKWPVPPYISVLL